MQTFGALRRLGIDIAPYAIFVEDGPIPKASAEEQFDQELVTGATIGHVLDQYGNSVNSGKWRQRVASGDSGLLLERQGELVGYTWASERCFLGIDNRPLFELAAHEAYLFDTFVFERYRGRGIAGLMRELMCNRLVARGRTMYYSFVLLANRPALRFKEKLRASPVETRVRIRLFGLWFVDLRLRRRRIRVPAAITAGRLGRSLRPV